MVVAGVIGKLSEGAVFLLFLPRPPDRFPFCCSPPTPEPRGTFTDLGTPGGNKGRGARGGWARQGLPELGMGPPSPDAIEPGPPLGVRPQSGRDCESAQPNPTRQSSPSPKSPS